METTIYGLGCYRVFTVGPGLRVWGLVFRVLRSNLLVMLTCKWGIGRENAKP